MCKWEGNWEKSLKLYGSKWLLIEGRACDLLVYESRLDFNRKSSPRVFAETIRAIWKAFCGQNVNVEWFFLNESILWKPFSRFKRVCLLPSEKYREIPINYSSPVYSTVPFIYNFSRILFHFFLYDYFQLSKKEGSIYKKDFRSVMASILCHLRKNTQSLWMLTHLSRNNKNIYNSSKILSVFPSRSSGVEQTVRNMSAQPKKLSVENINPCIKTMEYAVRWEGKIDFPFRLQWFLKKWHFRTLW